jgi:hypothetical protein
LVIVDVLVFRVVLNLKWFVYVHFFSEKIVKISVMVADLRLYSHKEAAYVGVV